jgi:transposase
MSEKGVPKVPGATPRYTPEFKAEAIRLVNSTDKPASQIARELGVSDNALRSWVKQAQIDTGEREGLTTQEREELRRLRKENKVLRQEREILKKATVFFAREDGSRLALATDSLTRRRPTILSRYYAGYFGFRGAATTTGEIVRSQREPGVTNL